MPFKGSFVGVYTGFVNLHIETNVANGTTDKIMRRALEKQIMEVIDKTDLPLSTKLAWYSSVIVYDVFSAYWAGKQLEHKLARRQIMRYQPNYNMIWKIDQCELRHDGEDSEESEESEEDEDVESRSECKGAKDTTDVPIRQEHHRHEEPGTGTGSNTSSDYVTPTSSPAPNSAKAPSPDPTSLSGKVRYAESTNGKNVGPMTKKASIIHPNRVPTRSNVAYRALKGILKKTSAYEKQDKA